MKKANLLSMGAFILSAALPLAGMADSHIPYGKLAGAPLTKVGESPYLWNSVTVSDKGRVFVGMPHWPGHEASPSIAELLPNGELKPFPGGSWNTWKPGEPTATGLLDVNAIHIFNDDTLWVVDVGNPSLGDVVDKDAQKILQFDINTGKLLRSIHLDDTVLPKGANMNDIRRDQDHLYLTDSGLGGIIVVDLKTGKGVRRLHAESHTLANTKRLPIGEDGRIQSDGKGDPVQVHSDLLEVSPDGKWLYFQALTGPMWRVETRLLRDASVSEEQLSKSVEFVYDTPPITGTAMDNKGNLYMAEMDRPRITVLKPDGTLSVVAQDSRLWSPDALFITKAGDMFVPIPQTARQAFTQGPGAKSLVEPPYKLLKLKLPADLGTQEAVPPVYR